MAEKLPKVTASGVHQCRRSRPWWRVHPKRPWQSRYWLLRPWWWAHDKLVRLVPWLVVHLVPRRLLGRLEKRFDYGHVPPIAPDRLLAEPPRLSVWRSLQAPLLIFVLSLAGLALFSFDRLKAPSQDLHFLYQADAFLHGQLELRQPPPHGNDWASYVEYRLRSGQVLKGVWYERSENKFVTLSGEMYILDAQERRGAEVEHHYFVSFPPGPAVVMAPGFLIWGYKFNDVWFTVILAAFNLSLLYVLLRRLSRGGRSGRGPGENLLIVFLAGFGTNYLWCSTLGQVWFTALVVGVAFALLYLITALDTRHPILAGLFLACAFATRTPLLFTAFVFPALVVFPGGRLRRAQWGKAIGKIALFCIFPLIVGLALLYMNYARFENPLEFGHRYLAEGGFPRIRDYGLFNYHFLSRNLAAAFTLLPRIQPTAPYIKLSNYGMSLFLTTPVFFYLFRSRPRRYRQDVLLYRLVWVSVLVIAIPHFFYQNTGWIQFGYRFSMDYLVFLMVILAIGRFPFTRVFSFLVFVGFVVCAFGAITFGRMPSFYGEWFFEP